MYSSVTSYHVTSQCNPKPHVTHINNTKRTAKVTLAVKRTQQGHATCTMRLTPWESPILLDITIYGIIGNWWLPTAQHTQTQGPECSRNAVTTCVIRLHGVHSVCSARCVELAESQWPVYSVVRTVDMWGLNKQATNRAIIKACKTRSTHKKQPAC